MIFAKDLKFINGLQRKKNRTESGLFVVEGKKMIEELIQSRLELVSLFCLQDSGLANHSMATIATEKELGRMSGFSNSSECLAVARIPESCTNSQNSSIILALDGIRDPGNMGTIIRTADWFGIGHILCSDDCVDLFNPKVVQSSMGSLFRVNYEIGELSQLLPTFKRPIYGAAINGESIEQSSLQVPCTLILGSESHGIKSETTPVIDKLISIPKKGNAESLNVGVACGILCAKLTLENG